MHRWSFGYSQRDLRIAGGEEGAAALGGEGEVQMWGGQDTDTPRTRGAVIKTNRKLVSTAVKRHHDITTF